MARGKGRGGYQKPSTPAAVSGPGALSQRTDGGPAQPIRTPTGGTYGSAQELTRQQQAAPVPQQQPIPQPRPGGGGQPQPAADPFRPTDRPGEPGTEGVPVGPGSSGPPNIIGEDPDLLIRLHIENLRNAGLNGAAARLATFLRRA